MKGWRNILFLLGLAVSFLFLFTCAIPGNVFIMIAWDTTTGTPNAITFTPALPGVPVGIGNISNGHYYSTTAGTYSVSYTFLGAPTGPFVLNNFTISPRSPLFGSENAYYDLIIYRSVNPILFKVPPS